MIVRAKAVVTMDGPPISDGAIRVREERIVQVGKAPELAALDEETLELDDCVLLPGLINAHCHLDYTCLRGKIAAPESFTDWIRAINAEKAKLTAEDYARSVAEGFREAKRFGTTALVNLEAVPELICLPTPLRMWWCAEVIDVSTPDAIDSIMRKAEKEMFGLAPHALFTASPRLYQRCQELALAQGLLLTTHLAESREEREMFRDAAGPLFNFLQSLGRDQSDCGRFTPTETFLRIVRDPSTPLRSAQDDKGRVRYAQDDKRGERAARDGERGGRSAEDEKEEHVGRWLVAHLNELTEVDFELLSGLPEKFSVAHCPRSHAYFRHSPFAFERLTRLGFNICLATDSLASNDDLSLFAEMRAFQKAHGGVSAEKILETVTKNPARSLGRENELGKIAPGFLADLIAVRVNGLDDVYGQIIAFEGETPWMMVGGAVV